MKNKITLKLVFATVLMFSQFSFAQEVTGKITDNANMPLPFANIVEEKTTNGTLSDINGEFTLKVSSLPTSLEITSVGYEPMTITVENTSPITITLQEGVALNQVVLVGSRNKPRSIINSAVAIDNIGTEEMRLSGQPTLDKMLAFKVPSFNSSNQTISDGTAHFDPTELRNLGPSRTLVLINGKRKNQSALVNINDTPGKGEVGVDYKSIPLSAIERVEVLRDGASAQYGSDAIAGVINMVLKRNVEFTTVNVKSGVTTEGDGFNLGVDVNSSVKLVNNGFLTLSAEYYKQEKTNRAGKPGEDLLFGISADDPTWGTFLAENPDLGMTVGQPDIEKGDIFFNAGFPFEKTEGEVYAFGGVTYREGKSFALYRAPYWVPDPFNLLHEEGTVYQGFQPTFETSIIDNFATLGTKWEWLSLNFDLSGTYGRNGVDYEVNNSINPALGASSPTSFKVGGYNFSNALANFDVSKTLGMFNFAVGAEIRNEKFVAKAGQPESYFGSGVQSFPGLQTRNAVNTNRDNLGVYADVEVEPTTKLLLGGAVRYEDYSDFGDKTSFKAVARYTLGDNQGALRGSYSTGFRAPSMHQIFLSNIQTLISGGTVSNQGTFSNVDPIIRDQLGVPQLKAETSRNISAGITYKFNPQFYVTLDYYRVEIDDRVLFTGEIGFDGDDNTINPVEQVLIDNSITSLKFFVNAVDTKTNGVDLVANYNNIDLGSGSLNVQLAANYNKTEIDGQIDAPQIFSENGYDIFNRKEQSRITTARPDTKVLLGLNYNIGKWGLFLNNTYFGEVTWAHFNNGLNGVDLGNGPLPVNDEDFDQTFKGKVITDLTVSFKFSNMVSFFATANNLFDVFPDEIDTKGDFVTDLGGRFKYPWEVNQFGFSGTILNAGLTFKF